MAQVMVLGDCWSCGAPVMECPDCVVTVWIDPVTNRPRDTEIVDGRAIHVEPSPEVIARSTQQMLCDSCVMAANVRQANPMQTAKERHKRHA